MPKIFWKAGLFVVGLATLAFSANFFFSQQIKQSGNLIRPVRLKALMSFYDFGLLPMAAGKRVYSFEINNVSQESVEVGKFYTSCRCATANLIVGGQKIGQADFLGSSVAASAKEVLSPNQTATVEVIFDPAAEGPAGTGLKESFVYLEDKSGMPLKLGIRALVKL